MSKKPPSQAPRELLGRIATHVKQNRKGINSMVLVGGCSRAGKTTFSYKLRDELQRMGIQSLVLSMDHWLLPVSARPANSTVLQRYRVREFTGAVERLLAGQKVEVQAYEPKSRELYNHPCGIEPLPPPYLLIVEGTISLAIEKLRKTSCCNIYIKISDLKRLRALICLYKFDKMLDRCTYKSVIRKREIEEVPYIKETVQFADFNLNAFP